MSTCVCYDMISEEIIVYGRLRVLQEFLSHFPRKNY